MKTENNKIHCWAEDKLFLIWIIINKTKPEDRHFFSYFIDNKDEHKFGREVKGFIEALGLFNVKMNNPKFDYEFYQMEDKKMGNQYEKGLLEECKDKDFEDNIKNILKLCYSKRKFTALEIIKLSNRYEQFLEMTEEDGRDEKDRDQSVMLMYELIRRQREER